MLGCHVVLLADVFGDVEQLLLARLVVIHQLPLVLADGAVQIDARSVIAPDVGEVPHQCTSLRGVTRTLQQRHEADAVQRSHRLVILHARHLEQRRIEVFNHQILVATRVRLYHARPAHNHRLADTALVERTLAAAQRRVLGMHLAVAPARFCSQTAVVAHEDDDGVVGLTVLFEPVHQVAQTLVHTFDERSIGSFLVAQPLANVLGEEAHVLVDRHMDGIMGHVEVEGLVVLLGLVQRLDGFARQSLSGKDTCTPIILQSGNGHQRIGLSVACVAVVLLAQVGGQSAGSMAGNIHFKPPVGRILSRSVDGTPMGFAAMDGVITALTEQFDEGSSYVGIVRTLHLTDTIVVPVGQLHRIALAVGLLVALQRPVGHPMAGIVGSRNEAAPGSRTDVAGIRLSEHHALLGQPLHIRRLVGFVVRSLLGPEGQRGILPSHVIYHKENNVGTFLLLGNRLFLRRSPPVGHGYQRRQRQCCKQIFIHKSECLDNGVSRI